MLSTEDFYWTAMLSKDPSTETLFVYGVRTTKIHCRPTCKARLARRANVTFFTSSSEATEAGYRPCKRCKPELSGVMPEEEAERRVRDLLLGLDGAASLVRIGKSTSQELAQRVGLSKWHFHRVFKRITGVTPGLYFRQKEHRGALADVASAENSDAEFAMILDQELEEMDGALGFGAIDEGTDHQRSWADARTEILPLQEDSLPASNATATARTTSIHQPDLRYHLRPSGQGFLIIVFKHHDVDLVARINSLTEVDEVLISRYPGQEPMAYFSEDALERTSGIQEQVSSLVAIFEPSMNPR